MSTQMPKPGLSLVVAACLLACTLNACDGNREGAAARLQGPAFARADDATEVGYFNGDVYRWQFPSGASNNQNELVLPDCFRVGPDFTTHTSAPSSATLYAVFLPGANQHACPDGSDVHDHVLSAVPGSPGYATLWDLKEVWPGEAFDPSIMPITSESDLLKAAALGQVVIIDDEILLKAVVLGQRN